MPRGCMTPLLKGLRITTVAIRLAMCLTLYQMLLSNKWIWHLKSFSLDSCIVASSDYFISALGNCSLCIRDQVLIVAAVVTSAACIATRTCISAPSTTTHLRSQRSASTIPLLLRRKWRRYEIGCSCLLSVTLLAINFFVDFNYRLCINFHRRVFVCCVTMCCC